MNKFNLQQIKTKHLHNTSGLPTNMVTNAKVEVAKRIKRWWSASVDGKINLVVRYGGNPLEFAKGQNAIELGTEAEVADVLAKVRKAAENGELDALLEKQSRFGRRVTQKNERINEQKSVLVAACSSSYDVQQRIA